MNHANLLCFKVCYCLGISDETLQEDYPVVHGAARMSGYLSQLKVTRTYRAISHVYFAVLRNHTKYAPGVSFRAVSGTRFDSYLKGTDFVPATIYQETGNVEDFLYKIADISRKMIPALYDEIKPSIDYLSFERLVRLEPVTMNDVHRISFILRRIPRSYNVYFFASDVLNLALRDVMFVGNALFKTDVNLCKGLHVAFGRSVEKKADDSELAHILNTVAGHFFVTVDDIIGSHKRMYLSMSGVDKKLHEQICNAFEGKEVEPSSIVDIETFKELWDEDADMKDGTVLILKESKESVVTELLDACPELKVVLIIPISRHFYKKVLSGAFENRISLLAIR